VKRPISVQKFGSSVLEREDDLQRAVHAIFADVRAGYSVIAVVSALGNTTDELLAEARAATFAPDPRVLARLLATGEARAAALLSLAIERAGLPVGLLGSENAGIVTEGPLLDASPIGLDEDLLLGELAHAPVVVLPGFVGRRVDGELTLLGRGGSDLTAVYVAGRLRAERCVLFKDVDGLYEWDPRDVERGAPRRFANCAYTDVLALPEGIVQHKAVTTARALGLAFEVGRLVDDGAGRTCVSQEPSTWFADTNGPQRPLRIALLGLGTVGGGVLTHLLADPARFQVRNILVRDLDKHIGANRAAALGVDARVFTNDVRVIQAAAASKAQDHSHESIHSNRAISANRAIGASESGDEGAAIDLVIEALGGVEPAATWLLGFLNQGVSVITANKAAVAKRFDELHAAAAEHAVFLGLSATVGGVVPALETARRLRGPAPPSAIETRSTALPVGPPSLAGTDVMHPRSEGAPIRSVEGVLNGTSSFVLDRLASGESLEEAVAAAQARGLAEADPTMDLDGSDVVHKLLILAATTFAERKLPAVLWMRRAGIEAATPDLFAQASAQGGVVRLVARACLASDGALQLEVAPQVLCAAHPLGRLSGAGNGVCFEVAGQGVVTVRGEGAGRWPTAESVMGDVFAALACWRRFARIAQPKVHPEALTSRKANPPRAGQPQANPTAADQRKAGHPTTRSAASDPKPAPFNRNGGAGHE
jgi:homoserine dehydrogenase